MRTAEPFVAFASSLAADALAVRALKEHEGVPLFTVLMEFKGGTYLSQLRAPSPDAALEKWARDLDVKNIEGMTETVKRQFVEWLPEARPTVVAGLKSTWCSGFVGSTTSALVHIFRTTDR